MAQWEISDFTIASTQPTVVVTVAAKAEQVGVEPAAKSNEAGEIVVVGFPVVQRAKLYP